MSEKLTNDNTLRLDTPVQYVKGVGPYRSGQLAELGIQTVQDLMLYFPRRFDLRRQAMPIATLRGDEAAATVAGEVVFAQMQTRTRKPFFEVCLRDGADHITCKWFHGEYLQRQIVEGIHLALSGRTSVYRGQVQMINPQFQVLWRPETADLDRDELLPVYPAGAGLTSAIIGRVIHQVLPQASGLIDEWYTPDWLDQRALMGRPRAVAAMHRPEDQDQWKAARRRLAYDEFLLMQLAIGIMRLRQVSRPAHAMPITPRIDERIRARFPFPLTQAQDAALGEIVADLARNRPMNRLLQGDVGCGKTVVALYAALLAVANRHQVAILAPTEILARQHHRKICEYLEGSKVRTGLLVGGMAALERKRTLEGLVGGSIDVVIGTHALLSEGVKFRSLGLVVVDEQHKFGVRQRSGLRGKGYAPHYLVMTATPIPRTLAMTVFGDLDVSTIDAAPPGRGTTTTRVVEAARMAQVYKDTRRRLAGGQQAYFIYPLVNAAPGLELTAAQDAARELARGPLADFTIGLVHGQMSSERKQAVMQEFHQGRVQVLVASVVVEVGLDVPQANIIVVHHAERFGLAQLHQLRGRVGRGEQDAVCFLLPSAGNAAARERLAVLERTSNGFEVAEEDLRLRGPGELFGTRQHGLPELKVGDLIEDFDLLRLARRDAFALLEQDPALHAPHHQRLRAELVTTYGGKLQLLTGA